MRKAKIAIVAEWLTTKGGAEKVVEELIDIFPQAQIFTTVFNPKVFPELVSKKPVTSFLQKIPALNKRHQMLGPLMPKAIESLNLTSYDIIISSSSAFGKGIKPPKGSIHICYCHTPMRYIWQTDIDKRLSRLPLSKPVISALKKWDIKSNGTVDYFVTNSKNSAQRIKKYYNRDAQIIYPPVSVGKKLLESKKGDYFLSISRLVGYKRFDLAILACESLGKKLIVAGSGPKEKAWQSLAGKCTTFVGRVDNKQKTALLSQAKALIFPAEEDFGIVPIEAMALETPVVAYAKGGSTETVIDGKTGVLFKEQTVESLKEAILKSEEINFNPNDLTERASLFSKERFDEEITKLVNKIKEENKWT